MRRPGNPRGLGKDEILTLLDMLTHDTLADMNTFAPHQEELITAFTRRADAFRAALDESLAPQKLHEKSEKALRLELTDLMDASEWTDDFRSIH